MYQERRYIYPIDNLSEHEQKIFKHGHDGSECGMLELDFNILMIDAHAKQNLSNIIIWWLKDNKSRIYLIASNTEALRNKLAVKNVVDDKGFYNLLPKLSSWIKKLDGFDDVHNARLFLTEKENVTN